MLHARACFTEQGQGSLAIELTLVARRSSDAAKCQASYTNAPAMLRAFEYRNDNTGITLLQPIWRNPLQQTQPTNPKTEMLGKQSAAPSMTSCGIDAVLLLRAQHAGNAFLLSRLTIIAFRERLLLLLLMRLLAAQICAPSAPGPHTCRTGTSWPCRWTPQSARHPATAPPPRCST